MEMCQMKINSMNTMTEQWSRWEPVANLKGKFFIEDLRLFHEGLVIQLCAQQNDTKIEILFDGSLAAYRYINESWCFNIFGELGNRYGDDFYVYWSFFKINNSNYVKSLSPISAGTSESTSFYHFSILGDDEIVDILATYEPTIKVIEL